MDSFDYFSDEDEEDCYASSGDDADSPLPPALTMASFVRQLSSEGKKLLRVGLETGVTIAATADTAAPKAVPPVSIASIEGLLMYLITAMSFGLRYPLFPAAELEAVESIFADAVVGRVSGRQDGSAEFVVRSKVNTYVWNSKTAVWVSTSG